MFDSIIYNYWVINLSLIFVLIALSVFMYRYLFKFLFWLTEKTPNKFDDRIVEAIHKPLPTFVFVTGFYKILSSNKYILDYNETILIVYQSFLIICLFWAINRFIHTYEKDTERLPFGENKPYAPYILRLVKALLLMVAFYLLLENWGYDLSKLLAGLGITGIAFAFAARETFSNIFSGMVIIIEKPFSIGEHISNEDIDGTITDINFRSTTINTTDKVQIIVPNSKLVNSPLINKTRTEELKVEAYVAFERKSISSTEVKETLGNCIPEGMAVEDSVAIKVESVYSDYILFKVFLFSSLSAGDLAEFKQEYLNKVLTSCDEAEFAIRYLGFEKPNMIEFK